jgi:LysM repeat protein
MATKPGYPVKMVDGTECMVYTVQKSEGFYRVCKNFNTTEAVIRQYNPHIGNGLKVGMEILIPLKQSARLATDNQTFIEHLVEKKQTIFRIRKMYDITEEELIQYNPQLKERSLQVGERIKIPTKKPLVTEKEISNGSKKQADNNNQKKDTVEKTLIKPESIKFAPKIKDTLDLAFFLPFMSEQQKTDINDSRFIEFYSGALIAIHEAGKKGMNFNIHTFDTEKSEIKMMEILQQEHFENMDLIVGPAFASQVSVIGDFSRMFKINTLIPFSSKIFDLEINPYIFQFNPGQDAEINKIIELIRSKNYNLIFADLPNIPLNDEGNQLSTTLKNLLNQYNIPYNNINVDPAANNNFTKSIIPQKENIMFFNTNKINSLINCFKEINVNRDNKFLKIYEPYSWRGTSIERPASFYFSVFRDEPDADLYAKYEQMFNQLFDWTPINDSPRYDLLGYDLMNYFINQVLTKEKTSVYPVMKGIQSNLQFVKHSDRGGYINKQLNYYE